MIWHHPSLWLEWMMTFPCAVATDDVSKFTDILGQCFNSTIFQDWVTTTISFVIMLPRAHLTSHPRRSNSEWVITPLWLFASLRLLFFFLYTFYVYSCHFFLISSASVRALLFLPFVLLILAWIVPWISPIILKTSLFFPILLFSSITLHSSF